MRHAHDDRAPDQRPTRISTARPAEQQIGHRQGVTGDITRLQRLVGNRAVVTTMDGQVLQRHPGETQPEEVGEPAAGTETTAEQTTGPTEGREVEPGTGTGTGTGTGGGAGARAPSRQAQVYAKLNTTTTGRWALGVIDRWSIPVDYNFAGTGSFHRAGKIFVNRSLSIDAAAIVTMHEAQHANTFKSGNAADIMTLSRAEYVRLKIADEAEAVVRQIEGSVPMVAAGASLGGSGVTQALIDLYRAAFYRKRDELEAADPTLTRAQINDRCRTFTRDNEVTTWFHNGTFTTSTGGAANVTYTQHYGRAWDAARNPPSPSPEAAGGG